MNEDLDQLEHRLRSLKPRPVSRDLRASIAAELETVQFPARSWYQSAAFWSRAAAVLALAVGALALWMINRQKTADSPAVVVAASAPAEGSSAGREPEFEPVDVRTVLVQQHDDGVVAEPDFAPAHKFTRDLVDHMEWRSNRGRDRYILTRPRKEVMFVSMDTY